MFQKNLYLIGAFTGTVDFDPSAATYTINSTSPGSIFILKLDASGNFVWVNSIDGNNNNNIAYSIAIDLSKQVYVTGGFTGNLDVDPGLSIYTINSAGSKDVFILKLDSLGNFIWAKGIGGAFNDGGSALVVDASENVYTIGSYSATVDFDPGPGTYNLSAWGMFILKLNASGNFVWVKALNGNCGGSSISLDYLNNIYTSGVYIGLVNYDNGAYNFTANGKEYILKLDANANFIWAASLIGNSSNYSNAIVPDNFGNCYVTGSFSQTYDFDPNPATTFTLTAIGLTDIFVLKLGSGLTTGIQKLPNSEALALKIYPNPNNGIFTIESDANIPLNIINSMGQLVAQIPAVSKTEVNVENLPPGIYFVIGNTTTQYVNQKIIVVR
jgi:hypothetical protein